MKPIRVVQFQLCILFTFFHFFSFAQQTQKYVEPDEYYRKAEELYIHEKYAAAQLQFQQYLASGDNPYRRIQAEYHIASCALYLEQPQAEFLFTHFVNKYPNAAEAQHAYYELGNYYFDNKNYEKAIDYYSKSSPSNLNTDEKLKRQFNLGYAHFTQREINEAEPLFDQVKRSENKYQYAAYYYSGYIKFKKENYREALSDFQTAGEHPTYKEIAPYMVVQILYKTKAYQQLIGYTSELLDSKTKLANKAEIILFTADAHFYLEQYESAIPLFEDYISAKKSADNNTYYKLGYAYIQTGNYEQSITALKNIGSTQDTLGQYGAYYLGTAYIKTRNLEYAENAFLHASKLEFNKEIQQNAQYNLIKIYYENDRFDLLLTACNDYLATYKNGKDLKEVNTLLSEALLHTQNYEQAIAYIDSLPFSNAIIEGVYQEACYYTGVSHFNAQELEEALAYFKKSLKYPYDKNLEYETWYWIGEIHALSGEQELARAAYNKVLAHVEKDSKTYLLATYGLAYSYFYSQKYSEAKQQFTQFVNSKNGKRLENYYADAFLRIGDVYYLDKDFSSALSNYDKAINTKTKAGDYAYFQKGKVYSVMPDQAEAAKTNFRKVVSQYPNSIYKARAYYGIAEVSFTNAQYTDAIAAFTTFLEKEPNHVLTPTVYLQRGIAYHNTQAYQKAVTDYDKILNDYCKEAVASQALSAVQQTLTKIDKASSYHKRLEQFEACNPDNKDLEEIKYNVALGYYQSFEHKEAIKAFTAFLDKYPASAYAPEINFNLANSYYALQDDQNAFKYFDMVYENGPEKHKEKSLLRLARLSEEKGDFNNSIRYNKALLPIVTSERKRIEGLFGLVKGFYEIQQYDSALVYVDKITGNEYAPNYIVDETKIYEIQTYYGLEKWQETKDLGNQLAKEASDKQYGVQGKYWAARVLYEQGNYESTLSYCREINTDFSGQTHYVGKSYLLIAKAYLALNENFQAEATLQSIVDNFPEKEIVDEAAQLLADLQEKSTQADTTTVETQEVQLDSMLTEEQTETSPLEIQLPVDSIPQTPNE